MDRCEKFSASSIKFQRFFRAAGCRPLRQARMPDATFRNPDATFGLLGAWNIATFLFMSGANDSFADAPPPNPLAAGLHFRGKLPHLKKEGAVYFVTFRLADSLPAHCHRAEQNQPEVSDSKPATLKCGIHIISGFSIKGFLLRVKTSRTGQRAF
jgi:hypothetical protein